MKLASAMLGLALFVAGCAGTPVTEETAKAAPARLQADMGPEGALSAVTGTMAMRMTLEMGESRTTMEMDMAMEQEFHQGGATTMVMRYTRFDVSGASGEDAPDLTGLRLTIFCSPDRWVIVTAGMADLGQEDGSVETENTTGRCAGQSMEGLEDLGRLAAAMGPALGSMGSNLAAGFQAPAYEFVALDGDTATYRMSAGGMEMNVTATFDGEGRMAQTTMTMEMQAMGMTLEADSEYEYGERSAAPETRGDRKV